MNVRASAEILGRIPIFSDCERAHLQVLAFSARNHSFAPGDPVIRQGTPATRALLILDGIAELSVAERGGLRKLGNAGPGVLLGELAMISGHHYSVTATAKSLLTAADIERDTFLRVAGEFPEFGLRVQKALARKLEAMVSELASVRPVFDKARAFAR
ncbi:MAG: cyclic nucleotide-binding domain-containing protein [Rhizobiales bacterium]|nr:cyclic nucleotide-binding domain-containing protein [Hyphomicrobiales bacterium]